jgi:hypothetical protein
MGASTIVPVPGAFATSEEPTWPDAFTPYTSNDGSYIYDKAGEPGISPVEVDITSGTDQGIGNLPSVYVAADSDSFYVRLRVKGDPYDRKGGFLSSVWLVQLTDAQGVPKATVGINGKSPHEDYVYVANANGTNVEKVYVTSDAGDEVPGTRILPAENGQYFVDFQAPIERITAVSNEAIRSDTPIKLYFATSKAANLSVINKDGMSEGAATTESLAVIRMNAIAPTVTIQGGAAKKYDSGSGFTLTGTSSHANVSVKIEGTACEPSTYTAAPVVTQGAWSVPLPACVTASNGTYAAIATVTNASGQTAAYSQEVAIDVNQANSIAIDGGAAAATNQTSLTFRGSAVGSGKVHLYVDGVRITGNSGENVQSGRWTSSAYALSAPSDGKTYVVTAKFSENPSSPPLAMAVQKLTYKNVSAVVSPTVTINDIPADGSAKPSISGTSGNASVVEVAIDGVTVGIVDGNPSAWSISLEKPLNAGARSITARAKSSDGNTAVASKTHNVTVTSVAIDNGETAETNDSLPAVRGRTNAANDATVRVQLIQGADIVKSGDVHPVTGVWRFESAGDPLPDGIYTVTATVVGAAATSTQRLQVDTATTVSITEPANLASTSERKPTIRGDAESGATIDLHLNEGWIVESITADSGGKWSFTPSEDLAQGLYSVRATASDAQGNEAQADSAFTVTSVAPPTLVSATTNAAGTEVRATFDKAMEDPAGKHGSFAFRLAGGAPRSFSGAASDSNDGKTYVFAVQDAPIEHGDIVTLDYAAGAILSTDGGALASFDDEPVANVVPLVERAALSGTLYSSTGGTVADVKVSVKDAQDNALGSVVTDEHGQYVLNELPTVTGIVYVANDSGTVLVFDHFTLSDGQVTEKDLHFPDLANIALEADPSALVGDGTSASALTAKLTYKADGAPVEGANVKFATTSGTLSVAAAPTDGTGTASSRLVAPEIVGVQPITSTAEIVVRDAASGVFAEKSIPITYYPATVEGVVTIGGQPVAGAAVTIVEDFGPPVGRYEVTVTTGPDGRYKLIVPVANHTYTIQVSAEVLVDGVQVPVAFEQTANVGSAGEGRAVTAVSQISGKLFLRGNAGTGLNTLFGTDQPVAGAIYDEQGNALPGKTVQVESDGRFTVEGLLPGSYRMLFQLSAGGEKLAGIWRTVRIVSNGEIAIEPTLIDPYGIVTDAVSGAPIPGIEMQLYWADTALNVGKDRTPHTLVALPILPEFAPNQNRNTQTTTASGEYAWMVFADGDYYLKGVKSGYAEYDSRDEKRDVPAGPGEDSYIEDGIIHVGQTIVEYDLSMTALLGAPGAPTQLRVDGTTESSVTLAWNASTGTAPTVYDLYRDGVLVKAGIVEPKYVDDTIGSGNKVTYKVVARNDGGASPASNEVQVRLPSLGEVNEDIKNALKKLKVQYAPVDIWESITLPLFLVKDGAYGTVLDWTSSHPEVISISQAADADDDGDGAKEFEARIVRKPTDTSVILTATVRKGSGTPLSRTFLLIVKSTAVEEAKDTKKRDDSSVAVNGTDVPVLINRTTLSNGNKIDKLIVSTGTMTDLMGANGGNAELKLAFGDLSGGGSGARADELAVEAPIGAIETLPAGMALQVATPEGGLKLPGATLAAIRDIGTDIYFRIVPIRNAAELADVESEAMQQGAVQAAVGNGEAEFLDIPREIETNYTGLATEVTLPLTSLAIPTDPVARQRYLDSLRVYIQHSDGTKSVVRGTSPGDIPGTIVYENGVPTGIAFTIMKFSTFTMFRVMDAAPAPVLFAPAPPTVEVVSTEVGASASEEGVIEFTLSGAPGAVDPARFEVVVGGAAVAVAKVETTGSTLKIHTTQPIPAGQLIQIRYASAANAAGALASFELELENGARHDKYINGYPDRTFKPENDITRAEVAAILTRLLNRGAERREAVSYPDVGSGHWAASSIEIMKETGIMEGYDDGEFKPEQPISRGEFAAVVLRFIGRDTGVGPASYVYPDIADHWARDLIQSLNDLGIMIGEEGMFYPSRNLTRAEAVTAINRAIGRGQLAGGFEPSWPDVPESHWAYGHVEEASRTHKYTRVSEALERWIRFLD